MGVNVPDIMITIATLLFSYSLIPQILKCLKLNSVKEFSWQFLIITAIGCLLLVIAFLSMKCYYSTFGNFIVLICYSTLIFMKWKFK